MGLYLCRKPAAETAGDEKATKETNGEARQQVTVDQMGQLLKNNEGESRSPTATNGPSLLSSSCRRANASSFGDPLDARSELFQDADDVSNRTKVTFLAFHSSSSVVSEMQAQPRAMIAERPSSSSRETITAGTATARTLLPLAVLELPELIQDENLARRVFLGCRGCHLALFMCA